MILTHPDKKARITAELLKNRLLEEIILDPGLADNDKLPSLRTITRRYNINHITLMRALDLLVKKGALFTEEKKGIYIRSIEKCRDAHIKNPIIAALLPHSDYNNGYYFDTVAGIIEQKTRQAGMRLIIQNLSWAASDISPYLDDFLSFYRAVSIITRVPQGYSDTSYFTRALLRGVTLVFIDSDVPEICAPAILVNNRKGGLLAARHLIKKKHRRIAFLRDSREETSGRTQIENDRFLGFRDALTEAGMNFYPEMDIMPVRPLSDFSCRDVEEHLKRHKLTGIFAYNDDNALLLIEYLSKRGIRIPDDISIIGFDNNSSGHRQLSSIDPGKEHMAEEAARLALARKPAKKKEIIILEPRIIIRSSVKTLEENH
ncbi:MAG: hypothetical protein A2096_07340 [Spirochaetes bacterium GWF1_41_5]|nr:MAG: hypothetical protein A2096_07340 [Spirochaetes bacterium GWF1_41_5]